MMTMTMIMSMMMVMVMVVVMVMRMTTAMTMTITTKMKMMRSMMLLPRMMARIEQVERSEAEHAVSEFQFFMFAFGQNSRMNHL